MFSRINVSACFLALVLPGLAGAQNQPNRNQLQTQPRFNVPFPQNQQPGIRTQMQQQPANRAQSFPLQQQQIQRWIEGLAPQQGNYPQQRQRYPQQSYPRQQQGYAQPQSYVPANRAYSNSAPAVVSAPAPARRAVLTGEQFRSLSEDEQQKTLQLATVNLEEELARMNAGESWATYLHLQTILRLLAAEASTELAAADRLRLNTAADQFDAVQANASLQRISSLWGFQTLRNGLRAYAAGPVERGKQRLRPAVDQLRDSLDQTTSGAGWKTYFQLDKIDKLAQSSHEVDAAAAATLREIISRFDQTSDSPDYQIVPQMAGFSATRDSLAQLADRMEQLADSQPRDADDMDRVVRTILQNLDEIGQACQKQSQAQLALATADSEHGRQALAVIQQRQREAMRQAQEGLKSLLAAIHQQNKLDPAMQTKRLANRDEILNTIVKLKAYDPSNSAAGIKVLASPDSSSALGTKQLSASERQRGADLIKRLKVYDDSQSSKRLTLQWPGDRQEEADETKQLADTNRVVEIVRKLFENSARDGDTDRERVEEFILMQFDDVPEEGEVTLMQFSDVEPDEITLMQFSDVPKPTEVWLVPLDSGPAEEGESDESE